MLASTGPPALQDRGRSASGSMAMLAKLPKLRQSYKALADLSAQAKPDAKAVQSAAEACVAAFESGVRWRQSSASI